MADSPAAVSAPVSESRAMTAPPPAGFPAPAAAAGVPAAPRPAGGRRSLPRRRSARAGAPADPACRPPRRARLRRPSSATTGSSRVGSSSRPTTPMSAPTPRSSPPRRPAISLQVPVVDNQVVHPGDLLARIDDGDYQARGRRGEGEDRHPGRDDRPHRPADRRAGGGHRPGRGADRRLARRSCARRGRRPARRARIRPFAQARADQLRLAAAARAGDRRPRPHRRRARRRQGDRRLGRRRARRRQGQSRRAARRSATRRRASARTDDRAGQGRARPLLHRVIRARSTASSATRRSRSAISCSRARGCMALVPLDASYVDANFKETQLGDIQPGQKVDVVDRRARRQRVSRASCRRSRRPRARSSRCCRPTTRPAISPRSCSACAVRDHLPRGGAEGRRRCGPGLSVVATVHTRDPDAPKPTLLGALGLEAAVSKTAKP